VTQHQQGDRARTGVTDTWHRRFPHEHDVGDLVESPARRMPMRRVSTRDCPLEKITVDGQRGDGGTSVW
jgi:hypothetical protein